MGHVVTRIEKPERQAGFTLVEVLIAIVVLAIGLLGMLGATASVIRTLGESDREIAAAYYAHQRLEQLEALGCDGVGNGSEVQEGLYNLAWTVDGTVTTPVRHITLTSTYPLAVGRSRTDTLEKALTCLR
jgi:prepilin-type N-terminal cleavage/methylation domain-containing protein